MNHLIMCLRAAAVFSDIQRVVQFERSIKRKICQWFICSDRLLSGFMQTHPEIVVMRIFLLLNGYWRLLKAADREIWDALHPYQLEIYRCDRRN